MGDYSDICELRGRAVRGKGCTLIPGLKYCAKTSNRKASSSANRDCTTTDVDTLVDTSLSFINTQRLKAAKAKIAAGQDIYIGLFGTSTSTGRGAGGGTFGLTAARNQSNAALLANIFNGYGIPASNDAIISTNNIGSSGALGGQDRYLEYNPFVTIGSTIWTADANFTVGGPLFLNSAAGDVGALTLQSVNPFNTVDVIFRRSSGGALMTLDIAGAVTTDVDANGASDILVMQTITTGIAEAVQTVNVKRKVAASAGNFRMVGIIPRIGAQGRVNVLTMGWSGGLSSNFTPATSSFSQLNALNFLVTSGRLDITIMKVGENDIFNNGAGTPIPVSTFKANMSILIATVQNAGGAVILSTIAPQNTPRDPTGAYAAYNEAVYQLASQYGCPVIDVFNLYGGSWVLANANGLMFDDVHSKTKGYNLEALAIMAFWQTL